MRYRATIASHYHPVIVKWKRPEFLYTDKLLGDSDLLSYRVTPDGSLNPLFSPQVIDNMENEPNLPETIMFAQSLKVGYRPGYLYSIVEIPSPNIDAVVEYRVNKKGGLMVTGSFAHNIDAWSLAVDNCYVFVLSIDPEITHYKIRSYKLRRSGGISHATKLSSIAGAFNPSMMNSHDTPVWYPYIRINLIDHLLYVIDASQNYIEPFRIRADDSLRALGVRSLPAKSNSFLFLPNGRYVYMTSASDPNVTRYYIAHNGALMHPITTSLGSPGTATALSKSGKFLYVSSVNRIISTFQVGANGNLRLLGISTIASVPFYLTVDQTGRFLYVLGNCDSGENCINQFHISGNGTLTPLQPEQVYAPESGMLITVQAFQ